MTGSLTRGAMLKTAKLYSLICFVVLTVAQVGCRTNTSSQPTPAPPTAPPPTAPLPKATVVPARPVLAPQTVTPVVYRGPVGTATPASGLVRVDAGDNFYYPDDLTVKVGTTVRWMHVGQTAHDVTARDKSWGIQLIPLGGYYEFTFHREGVYEYHCVIHNPAMTGKVIVVR